MNIRYLIFLVLCFGFFIPSSWAITERSQEIEIACITQTKKVEPTATSQSSSTSAIFNSGSWFKIEIDTSGIFKLSYDDLLAIGLDNPANVRLYGAGGTQLSYYNEASYATTPVQIPLYFHKGSDNIFNSGDYILFYGEGPTTWSYQSDSDMFEHQIHHYATTTTYFLSDDLGAGTTMTYTADKAGSASYNSTQRDSYTYRETNTANLVKSGRTWWGSAYKSGSERDFTISFPKLVSGQEVKGSIRVAGSKSSSATASFKVNYNNEEISTLNIGGSSAEYIWGYAYSKQFTYTPSSASHTLTVSFESSAYASEGRLDYLCLNTRETLNMQNLSQYRFRDVQAVDQSTTFQLNNGGKSLSIWDVTVVTTPLFVETSSSGNTTEFTIDAGALREFIAFDGEAFFTPVWATDGSQIIENQNLIGEQDIDYLIVSHEDFLVQANELAELHRELDGMNVLVTTPEKIYNEFSSGMPDVAAIRNFCRYLYDNASTAHPFKYLLLIGDGSYDNRQDIAGNSNYLLTYQSEESLKETQSFVSDDFFGLLDQGEGENYGKMDIGVGRFPVQTTDEAQLMVDKVRHYLSDDTQGSWQSNICFIGDDGDSNLHMKQPDIISKWINANQPAYNVNKIYFDAYQRESTPTGFRYPDVTEAINEQVKLGALIMDYVGHGNPRILGHEEVLDASDVKSWQNYDRLSIFVTASCEVGRYDDYERTSLGEWFILNEDGGSVAALTTTRVVYSGQNDDLNTNFFYRAFNPDYRLGDIIRLAKNNTTGNVNKRNFSLLGDPALKLAVPQLNAQVEYLNDFYVMDEDAKSAQLANLVIADTLNALSKANVSGSITDSANNILSDASGILQIAVYDKPDSVTCYGQALTYSGSDTLPFAFEIQKSILYKGQASITNGNFSFDFILPKDINYNYGEGKISLTAQTNYGAAKGYTQNFVIGGINTETEVEYEGPEIELYMNDTTFISGGLTHENPVLLARLFDDSGINTTGNGIGHNITLTLDDDASQSYNLNNYYQGYLDKYNCGEVSYPFYNLSSGLHTLNLKVWDIFNNSAEASLDFYVNTSGEISLSKIRNAPNPFADETRFMFEHNQSGTKTVRIEIFNLMGKKVNELIETDETESFNITPIVWNGTDYAGHKLPNGMYIYHIHLENAEGLIQQVSSKLMIFR